MIYCKSYDEARLEAINLLFHYDCRIKTITISSDNSKLEHWPFTVDYEDFSEEEYVNIL